MFQACSRCSSTVSARIKGGSRMCRVFPLKCYDVRTDTNATASVKSGRSNQRLLNCISEMFRSALTVIPCLWESRTAPRLPSLSVRCWPCFGLCLTFRFCTPAARWMCVYCVWCPQTRTCKHYAGLTAALKQIPIVRPFLLIHHFMFS